MEIATNVDLSGDPGPDPDPDPDADPEPDLTWHGADRIDDNYFDLEPIGLFHQSESFPYIYLAAYGWLYVHGMDPDNILLHDPEGRWLWSARHLLPYAWDYADETWTSLLPGTVAP